MTVKELKDLIEKIPEEQEVIIMHEREFFQIKTTETDGKALIIFIAH